MHNKISKLFFLFAFLGFFAYIIAIFLGIDVLEKNLYKDKKKEIKAIVDTMYSTIETINKSNLPLKEKKREIKQLIQNVRFNHTNYFWLFTNTNPPYMVIHPYFPNLNGKPLLRMKYNCATLIEYRNLRKKLNNENLFVAMVDILKNSNEGYVLYKWPKPLKNGISKRLYDKLSFIKLIPEENWVIGAGIYIDDIKDEYHKIIKKYLILSVVITLIMAFLFLIIFKRFLTLQKRIIAQQKEIEKLAFRDSLTGFLNRFAFDKKFKELLEKKEPFYVIFIDLDNFKNVNDTYGHETGDKLLIEVSKRIKNSIDNSIIARLGGDEFVIVIKDKHYQKVLKKLENSLSKEYKFDNIIIKNVSGSFGVAKFPEDGNTIDELLRKADLKMYENKKIKKGIK